jgi:RimJ/RimL family protein N-acetyltransferase
MLWTGHRFYLVGRPDGERACGELNTLFTGTIAPQALSRGVNGFVLHCHSDDWQPVIEAALAPYKPTRYPRHYYELTAPPDPSWRERLPAGYTLRRVDEALLANEALVHHGRLAAEVVSEGGTTEDFLRQRFGFCLLQDDELAGWCLSEFNSDQRCEVGIETIETHQRQGVATSVGHALAEHAFAHGLRAIGWHCWAGNTPSIATALRLGYQKQQEYAIYYGRLAAEE